MSERFYINLPLCVGPFILEKAEAHHLATVCRLRPGNEVCLFNGDGHEYLARIVQSERNQVLLEILAIKNADREVPCAIEVAAPLPKGDRSQFLIEKMTELGVCRFVPILCERSNHFPRNAKQEKLQRYVIEASKQCGRNVLMDISELTPWDEYLRATEANAMKIVAHPLVIGNQGDLEGQVKKKGHANRFHLAVGPEGGLTQEEIAMALHHDWSMLSLGSRILRVETAAIVMTAMILTWVSSASSMPASDVAPGSSLQAR